MTDYSVIRFLDEILGRIAPTELVKLLNRKKFVPTSAKDLPEGNVNVKWQKSFNTSSFSEDGYFEAEIFALAGSVKTAKAKAAELGIKLHPNPLLALPSAKDSPKSSVSRSRKCKDSSDGSKKELKNNSSSDAKEVKKKVGNKDGKLKHRSHSSVTVERNNGSHKPKRLKMSSEALSRTSCQASIASSTNPLLKETADSSEVKCGDPDDKIETDNLSEVCDDPDSKLLPNSPRAVLDAIDTDVLNRDGPHSSVPTDLPGSVSDNSEDGLNVTEPVINSEDDTHAVREQSAHLDAEKSLDKQIRNLDIPSSSESSSSSSESDESEEDEVSKLSEENKQLSYDVKRLKEALETTKRNMTLANNVRIAQKNELIKVKEELEEKSKLVDSLVRRNNTLQDVLSCKLEGTTKSKKVSSVHSPMKLSPRKRTRSVSPAKGLTTPAKESGSLNRSSTPKNNSFTVKLDFEDNSNPPPPKKKIDADYTSDSPPSKKKKRKSKDHDDLLNNPEVCEVSDTLLKHLQGSEPLVADKQGYISLGSVKMDKSGLERNLSEHKGDVQKLSKAIAALAWTVSQREERSLEGGKNNRFPNAPAKKAATPSKVNTCLGVLKAQLLSLGDTEGAGMAQNLKQARKALGNKFAQDGAQAKKRME